MTPDPMPPASYRRLTAARLANSHYARLGVRPSASMAAIRRAYRELSKRYHPDTTELAAEVATLKFQQLNEAYATLSNPERRALYDAQIGYAPPVAPLTAQQPAAVPPRDSAYLDPHDRPLSAGEIFALFAIAVTFLLCLLLALAVAIWRGDPLLPNELAWTGAIAATLNSKGSQLALNLCPCPLLTPPSTITRCPRSSSGCATSAAFKTKRNSTAGASNVQLGKQK